LICGTGSEYRGASAPRQQLAVLGFPRTASAAAFADHDEVSNDPNEATSLANEFVRIARIAATGTAKTLSFQNRRLARKNLSGDGGRDAEARIDAVTKNYWREVSGQAWKQAIKAAWGDRFAVTSATVSPVLIAAFVAAVTGAATKNEFSGVAAGFAALIVWTTFFFAIRLITVPARIHANLAAKLGAACEAIRAYNAVVDHSMVRNLLLRMREKCLAYRNNRVAVASQVQWAGELLADLSALYSPDTAQAIRRELPYLLDPTASPQTMDFYMRHLADRLLTQIDRVSVDFYSTQAPELNRFVRRRLKALQAEELPANEAPIIKALVHS
jgi:hypothetical protein